MMTDESDALDLLETLEITKIETRRSVGGRWVTGAIGGHRFEALVFPEHATSPDSEMETTTIKTWKE